MRQRKNLKNKKGMSRKGSVISQRRDSPWDRKWMWLCRGPGNHEARRHVTGGKKWDSWKSGRLAGDEMTSIERENQFRNRGGSRVSGA